jgi:RNA polymerase sigma factor (sigma-70 family)
MVTSPSDSIVVSASHRRFRATNRCPVAFVDRAAKTATVVELIRATPGEDGAVFAELRQDLVRYATALVGPSDAEDVVMTVVGRTVRRRRLSELENPKGYLLRGILNEARGTTRRKGFVPLDINPAVSDGHGLTEVLDVLMALPVRQRAAIYLRYWEGAPISEIADLMNVVPGTVKRYLHLARKKLEGVL